MSSINEILTKSKNPEKKKKSVISTDSEQNQAAPKKINKIKKISSIDDILNKNSIDKSKLKIKKKTTIPLSPRISAPIIQHNQQTIAQKTDALAVKNPIGSIDQNDDFSIGALKSVLPIPLDLIIKPDELNIVKGMMQKRFNVTKIEDNVNMIKIGISMAKRILSLYNISETNNKDSDSPYDNLVLC